MRTDRKLRKMLLDSTTSCVVNYDDKEFNKVKKYLSMIKHTKSPKRRSKYLNIIEKICLRRIMRKFNKLDNNEKIDIFNICNIFESIDLGIPQEYKYVPVPGRSFVPKLPYKLDNEDISRIYNALHSYDKFKGGK